MLFSFRKLSENDFPFLLKWMLNPHVKAWWDPDVVWSLEKVAEKYRNYVLGFKLEQGKRNPIFAYIIESEGRDIGYIQYYCARDFLQLSNTFLFPKLLAGIDFYIGEPDILGQGIGMRVLSQFMQQIVFTKYDAVLVTPDIKNTVAISCYLKAGFSPMKESSNPNELWLVARKEGVA